MSTHVNNMLRTHQQHCQHVWTWCQFSYLCTKMCCAHTTSCICDQINNCTPRNYSTQKQNTFLPFINNQHDCIIINTTKFSTVHSIDTTILFYNKWYNTNVSCNLFLCKYVVQSIIKSFCWWGAKLSKTAGMTWEFVPFFRDWRLHVAFYQLAASCMLYWRYCHSFLIPLECSDLAEICLDETSPKHGISRRHVMSSDHVANNVASFEGKDTQIASDML